MELRQIRWPREDERPAVLVGLTTHDVMTGIQVLGKRLTHIQRVGDLRIHVWTLVQTYADDGLPIVIVLDRDDDSFVWCVRLARPQTTEEHNYWQRQVER